jgi:hypothetical protein
MHLELLLTLLFLATAVMLTVGLGFLFARSPTAGVVTLTAAYIATEGIAERVALKVTAGGFTIYALDVIATLMLGIGLARLLGPGVPSALSRPLLVLVGLLGLHLLWGASQFGLQTTVTSGRPWLHVLAALVFSATATPHWSARSFKPLILGALALSVYALTFIARYGLHGANTALVIDGRLSFDSRPVTGTAALLMVQCVLILVSARGVFRSPVWLVALVAMGVSVALVQFRTVWVIAGIALTIAYLHWARRAIFTNQHAALLAASVLALIAPVAAYAAASSSSLGYSVESATGHGSTLRWRTESWSALMSEHDSAKDIVMGLPTGTSLARTIDGQVVDRSPHNVYLDSLLSFGIAGTVVLVWLGVVVVKRRRVAGSVLELTPSIVVLLVLAEAVFGVTTMFGPAQGILTGILLQAACVTGDGTTPSAAATDR